MNNVIKTETIENLLKNTELREKIEESIKEYKISTNRDLNTPLSEEEFTKLMSDLTYNNFSNDEEINNILLNKEFTEKLHEEFKNKPLTIKEHHLNKPIMSPLSPEELRERKKSIAASLEKNNTEPKLKK